MMKETDGYFNSVYRPYVWELKFAWKPHKCSVSGKQIWLQFAYRGDRTITGPGTDVHIYTWMTSVEYLIKQIKNEI